MDSDSENPYRSPEIPTQARPSQAGFIKVVVGEMAISLPVAAAGGAVTLAITSIGIGGVVALGDSELPITAWGGFITGTIASVVLWIHCQSPNSSYSTANYGERCLAVLAALFSSIVAAPAAFAFLEFPRFVFTALGDFEIVSELFTFGIVIAMAAFIFYVLVIFTGHLTLVALQRNKTASPAESN